MRDVRMHVCLAVLTSMLSSANLSANDIPFWNPVLSTKQIYCSDTSASFKLQKLVFGDYVLTWKRKNDDWEKFRWHPMANSELITSKCDVYEGGARCQIAALWKDKVMRVTQTINFDLGKFVIEEPGHSPSSFDCY